MKILAIRGKNLASLAGEFEIDFTAEPLRSAGIFAITGTTGSGKSTLLDALCLALFDKTPRTEGSSDNISVSDTEDQTVGQKDTRNILRRGTAQGYAEVDFKAPSGICYRSRWSVGRAREKVTGKLKNTEIRVRRLDSLEEIQGTKTEILARLQELLEMNFEQFTRSVLLAQNDFSTFLKAKQNEKAELLEKLTGTDIYSRISKTVYERSKIAEEAWNGMRTRISDIELLPEEELGLLAEEMKGLATSVEGVQKEQNETTRKLEWLRNREILIQERDAARMVMDECRTELDNARPRFDRLKRIDSIHPVGSHYQKKCLAQMRLEDARTRNEKLKRETDECFQKQKVAENIYRDIEKRLKHIEDIYKRIEPELKKAADLDIRIESGRKITDTVGQEVKKISDELNDVRQSAEDKGKELSDVEKLFCETEVWIREREYFREIAPHASLIRNLIRNAETAQGQIASNTATLKVQQDMVKAQEERLDVLKKERDELNKRQPKELLLWRARLSDGEPCPVCGSIHHPFVENGNMDEEALQAEDAELLKKQADEMIDALSHELEQSRIAAEGSRTLIQSYENSLREGWSDLSDYLKPLSGWETLFYDRKLNDMLRETGESWKSKTEALDLLTERRKSLQEKLTGISEQVAKLSVNLQEKELLLISESEPLNLLIAERKNILPGESRTANEIEQNYEKTKQECTEKLDAARANFNDQVRKYENRAGLLSGNETEIKQLSEEIQDEKRQIEEWIAGFNRTAEAPLCMEELSELLSEKAEQILSEREKLAKLTRRGNMAKATLAERKKKLITHEADSPVFLPEESEGVLLGKRTELNDRIDELQKRNSEISLLLENHRRNLEKAKQFGEELRSLEATSEKWKKLNELIGSQSGDKFKRIAQGYTLDILLLYANKHLNGLSRRYELQRIPDSLGLQITDTDMGGEIRSVHSLSGGESFLVSLALALGLSSVSSNRMQVESLFIDEGFGSLDMETLRTAMDALERLQTGGRKIGVISHVQEMTERIAVQVRVEKAGNGKSKVTVNG